MGGPKGPADHDLRQKRQDSIGTNKPQGGGKALKEYVPNHLWHPNTSPSAQEATPKGCRSRSYGAVDEPQPVSSGPEQVLGDVVFDGRVGAVAFVGVVVELLELAALVELLELEPLEPLEPLLAWAMLTVVIAGAA